MSSKGSAIRWDTILWLPTLVVNFERLVAASLVWAAIAFAIGARDPAARAQALVFLMAPLAFPVFAPFAVVMQWLANRGVPLVGWIALFCKLFLVMGDPVMWLVHRVAPRAVPVDRYSFFDRHLILFVVDDHRHPAVAARNPRRPLPAPPPPPDYHRPYDG